MNKRAIISSAKATADALTEFWDSVPSKDLLKHLPQESVDELVAALLEARSRLVETVEALGGPTWLEDEGWVRA